MTIGYTREQQVSREYGNAGMHPARLHMVFTTCCKYLTSIAMTTID